MMPVGAADLPALQSDPDLEENGSRPPQPKPVKRGKAGLRRLGVFIWFTVAEPAVLSTVQPFCFLFPPLAIVIRLR